VTEQRAAEEALRDADRRKDQFIATLAHELRNPLAPIRTAVAILGREGTAEPDRAWSRRGDRAPGGAHGALVDDLLDVARVSSGKLLLRRERVTLAAVVSAALETSRPALEAAGHKLVTRLPAARRCWTPIPRVSRRCSPTCSTTRPSTPRRAAPSS
jgi:signal transduction histidine kinase